MRTQKAEQDRLERMTRRASRKSRAPAAPVSMTARDKEILDEIAKGLTYHEIGAALGVSHQRISQVANKHGIMRGRGVHVNRKEPAKRACAQCGGLTTNPKFCSSRCWGMANKNNAFNAKLTADQVVEIRKLLAQGTPLAKIADLFPVTVSEISHINTGRAWGHLQ